MLGHADAVVLNEGNLDTVTDIRVVVDDLGEVHNEADDLLGHVVAGSCLGAEDVGPRLELHVGVVLEHEIVVNDLIYIQVLALILVETLDLDVEQGVGV